MIYTSYFAKLRKIPSDIVPISICAKAPSGYTGLQYKKLAPSYSILMEYKENPDVEKYVERFSNEILSKLNREDIIAQLNSLSKNKDIVLLCYEKSSDFCHRHLVSEWIRNSGIACKEWTE